jgi:hypothetical protein
MPAHYASSSLLRILLPGHDTETLPSYYLASSRTYPGPRLEPSREPVTTTVFRPFLTFFHWSPPLLACNCECATMHSHPTLHTATATPSRSANKWGVCATMSGRHTTTDTLLTHKRMGCVCDNVWPPRRHRYPPSLTNAWVCDSIWLPHHCWCPLLVANEWGCDSGLSTVMLEIRGTSVDPGRLKTIEASQKNQEWELAGCVDEFEGASLASRS